MSIVTKKDAFLGYDQTEPTNLAMSSHGDIPGEIFYLLMEYTAYAMICISAFGMAGNILIIITYTKIGFSESINISYFALGVSDILCVIFLTWNAICFIPAFSDSDMPFLPKEFAIPTGGHTTDIFQKTTAWITAFISLERCLCVVFPLKIKIIVRRRRTIVIIVMIFILTVLPLASIVFYIYVFDVKFDAGNNQTLLRVTYRNSPLSNSLSNFKYIYKVVFLNSIPFAIILICAVVLAIHLNQSAAWRLGKSNASTNGNGTSNSNDEKAQKKYAKDMRIAKTVLAIALTFIFPGTLSTLRYVIALIVPEFQPVGAYAKFFRFTARLAFLLTLANSSVNFIIYYKMGTKFRATVNQILFGDAK